MIYSIEQTAKQVVDHFQVFSDSDSHCACLVADHLLGLYDKKPITEEWLDSFCDKSIISPWGDMVYYISACRPTRVMIDINDGMAVFVNGLELPEIKTRGQIRSLCNALGVDL